MSNLLWIVVPTCFTNAKSSNCFVWWSFDTFSGICWLLGSSIGFRMCGLWVSACVFMCRCLCGCACGSLRLMSGIVLQYSLLCLLSLGLSVSPGFAPGWLACPWDSWRLLLKAGIRSSLHVRLVFKWILGIRILIFTLTQQILYWLGHLPSFSFTFLINYFWVTAGGLNVGPGASWEVLLLCTRCPSSPWLSFNTSFFFFVLF